MYLKYLLYIIRHKWFVFFGCLKLGWKSSFGLALLYRGIVHDMSKFLPSEFFPYMNYFYGNGNIDCGDDEEIEREFDKAWLFHQHRNKHHWQYWILKYDDGGWRFIDIPDIYLLEMVADWYGAGRAIAGRKTVGPWYNNNKNKMLMSQRSMMVLETIIKNLDGKGDEDG